MTEPSAELREACRQWLVDAKIPTYMWESWWVDKLADFIAARDQDLRLKHIAIERRTQCLVQEREQRVRELADKWCDPEFWKDEGSRMDSSDCGKQLQAALDGKPILSPVPPE